MKPSVFKVRRKSWPKPKVFPSAKRILRFYSGFVEQATSTVLFVRCFLCDFEVILESLFFKKFSEGASHKKTKGIWENKSFRKNPLLFLKIFSLKRSFFRPLRSLRKISKISASTAVKFASVF